MHQLHLDLMLNLIRQAFQLHPDISTYAVINMSQSLCIAQHLLRSLHRPPPPQGTNHPPRYSEPEHLGSRPPGLQGSPRSSPHFLGLLLPPAHLE